MIKLNASNYKKGEKMVDEKLHKVVLGCLLHDIGKVVQRSKQVVTAHNHSEFGFIFTKDCLKMEDREVLDQILYHHQMYDNKKKIKKGIQEAYKEGIIEGDSLAFITYCADNIAAGCDRRLRVSNEEYKGWKMYRALHSVFNCLYDESTRYRYNESTLMNREQIPYPVNRQFTYSKEYYKSQLEQFLTEIKEASYKPIKNWEAINALISLLEKYFTFMADDTSNAKLADISLFDHLKMTAAFGSCLYLYLKENHTTNYYDKFLKGEMKFYSEKAFMIISFDLSGIQKFVYSIPSEGALKNMRGRSFYINLLMEFITDSFLKKYDLSRANVLYIGGGAATLLVPNLKEMESILNQFVDEINEWLTQNFQETLFLGHGCAVCSVYDFRIKYNKKYKEKTDFTNLLHEIQTQISKRNKQRFSAKRIRELNPSSYSNESKAHLDGERECKVCQSTSYLQNDDSGEAICPICLAISKNANQLLAYNFYGDSNNSIRNKDLFLIENGEEKEGQAFLLPFKRQMKIANCATNNTEYAYNKNSVKVEMNSGVHFWVGDYVSVTTLEEMAERAGGIHRIAVIRADVDNLGESFETGFIRRINPCERETVSRKATYSRMLALFFQYYINGILEQGRYSLKLGGDTSKLINRNAAVVYSGGDDLFIVGGWDDVIGFAVDLYRSFRDYTQNKLTLSAGIGIYPPKYPISAIAKETGELEMCSKRNGASQNYKCDKDSITLFSNEFTFHWDCFIDKILGEKYQLIKDVFDSKECGERGITFLHTLLGLLKNIQNSQISLARYAFLIARLEPSKKKLSNKNKVQKESYEKYRKKYRELKVKLYDWMQKACENEADKPNDENDVKQCIVAIYLYLYLRRNNDGEQ